MRNTIRSVAAAAVFSSATFAAQAQQAVQWKVSDGGNGHWYAISILAAPIRLEEARQFALARGGDLASIATQSEYGFITPLLIGAVDSDGCYPAVYQGLTRLPGQPWKWTDGTPFQWSIWGNESDPMWPQGKLGLFAPGDFEPYCVPHLLWDDGPIDAIHPLHRGVFIEWSADCNNDGIVDYGQILSEQLVDANSNGIPDTCEFGPCAGDVIPDGVINGVDLAAVLSAWGTTGQGQFPADANRDGIVNGLDLSYVLSGWGPCVTVPNWATLLEVAPDPAIVTSPTLRAAIAATGRPWRVRDTATQIEFVLIPPGTFNMGCTASNAWGCDPDENPVHAVTLSQPFYLGRYEVTQAQWTARLGSNPSGFQSGPDAPQRPVENVSWNAIQTFLSQTSMRLPTEAEWEWAYRAGTTTAFHGFAGYPDGTNVDALSLNIAWMSSNSGGQPRPVGQKLPNGFGAYDLGGNVAEWLADWYSTTYYAASPSVDPQGPSTGTARVVRGGAWNVDTFANRAADRNWGPPALTSNGYGFRVVRNP